MYILRSNDKAMFTKMLMNDMKIKMKWKCNEMKVYAKIYCLIQAF